MVFKIPLLLALAQSGIRAQAKDCTGTLTKSADRITFTNAEIPYNAEVPLSANIGSGWKSFFNTSDDVDCQVRKCILMDQFCQDPYDGTRIAIGEEYPWQITAMSYDKLGYDEKFCLFCSIDEVHIYEEITVRQVSKCSPHISTSDSNTANTIRYSSDSSKVNIGNGWSSFFQNTLADGCPITSCTLRTPDCSAAYTEETFTIEEISPWTLSANRQNLDGYEESVCVQCLIQEDLSEISNNISVKQVGKLEVARIKFINYFTWDMVHGMVFKKIEECTKECGNLFWKNNCCAKVKMTGINYQTGEEDKTRTDFYCLNQAQADGNYRMMFDDVDFNIQCDTMSGAKVLAGITFLSSAMLMVLGY